MDKRLKEEDKEGLNQLVAYHHQIDRMRHTYFFRLARPNRSSKREKGRRKKILQKMRMRLERMEMPSRKRNQREMTRMGTELIDT